MVASTRGRKAARASRTAAEARCTSAAAPCTRGWFSIAVATTRSRVYSWALSAVAAAPPGATSSIIPTKIVSSQWNLIGVLPHR